MLCRKKWLYYDENGVRKISPNIGFIMGIIIFMLIYGIRILDPFYVDWLLGRGDLSQHYFGWEFYRRSPCSFPIGMTDRLAYPIRTSVVFTDSIPLFAVLFKIFSKILPEYFQYFGLWGILCFGLQGFFSTKIFNILNRNWICTLIGNVFIIVSPVLIFRMFMHTSLGAQWLILLCFYLLLKHEKDYKKIKIITIYWGTIGFLTAAIHLYFLPMCLLFVLGYVILSILKEKKCKIAYVLPMISYALGAVFNSWILGAFTSRAASGADGFEDYSFNLNSFYNPQDFSRVMPNLEHFKDFQVEGFAYIGLGMLCLSVVCMIKLALRAFEKKSINISYQMIVLIIIGMIGIFVAASPVITFGNKMLIHLPVPKTIADIWAIFRSTGRFILVPYYLIMFYIIKTVGNIGIYISKCKVFRLGTMLLLLGLVIQMFDMSDVLWSKHKRFTQNVVYEYSDSEFWDDVMEFREFKHLCITDTNFNNESFIKIAPVALKYDFTINGFYFARNIDGMWDNLNYLNREKPKADSVYVFNPEQTELMENCMHDLRYYNLDNFVIGVTWLDQEGNVNDFTY